MFETPRRLHYASIFLSGGAYLKQALFPLVLALLARPKNRENELAITFMIIGAIVGVVGLVGPFMTYWFTTYVIRDDSLIVHSGWLWKRTRVIPLARIQNVNTRQNLIHRLLGAAAVMVETAAGAGVEAELAAVSRHDAIELQNTLLNRKASSAEPAEAIQEPPPLYTLTPKQLFVAGALSNRFLYILFSVLGVFQFDELFRDLFRPILNRLMHLSPLQSALLGVGSFFGLLLIGWLLSIGYSLTRFFGFRMEKHPRGLKLSYGLFTRIQSVVPVGRVQTLRFAQPLFYQPYGYCEVYADTAGSYDAKELGGANKLCPLAPIEDVDTIGGYVFSDFRFSQFQWRRVSPRSVWRFTLSGSIIWTLVVGGMALGLKAPWIAIAWPFVVAGVYLIARLHFNYVGYAEQEGFLASRQGFWNRKIVALPLDRAQIISVNQSLFQRRWKLADLAVTTSAPAGVLMIQDLEADLAYALQDRLSRETVDRRHAWRGGN